MNRAGQVAFYLLLTFASGALVGVFGHKYYSVNAAASQRMPPDQFRNRMREEMRTRLKLDSKQMTEMDAAMDATRLRWREFRERHKDELRQMDAQADQEMRAMLRPEQLPEFEKLTQEREAKRLEAEKRRKSGK